MRPRIVAALAGLCLCACSPELPPRGQVRLFVDTDARLPPRPGEPRLAGEPAALFDSLRIDVYEPGREEPCEGCSRTFGLDHAQLAEGRASFGLPVASGVAGYRVRLRLYESTATLTGDVPIPPDACPACTPSSVIETVVALPVVGEEGIVDATVMLRSEDVGFSQGSLEAPLSPTLGPVVSSRVGTWPGARRIECAGSPGAGEVCVPGGAYWMGNPHAVGHGIGDAANQRRLVVVSPFFLDATEVTVGAYRALIDTLDAATRDTLVPIPWSGGNEGTSWRDFCSFSEIPGTSEDEPVVCVTHAQARMFCQLRGMDLPSEAQLEYVASGLEGRLFVWGSDQPACEDAVIARYGYGIFDPGVAILAGCQAPVAPGGAETVGSLLDPPRRDRLSLPGGTLYDLVGNAAEWALDIWNQQSEPCWSSGGVYRDPVCGTESALDGLLYAFRLGSYAIGSRQAMAAYRGGLNDISLGNGIDLGFRCARQDAASAR